MYIFEERNGVNQACKGNKETNKKRNQKKKQRKVIEIKKQ